MRPTTVITTFAIALVLAAPVAPAVARADICAGRADLLQGVVVTYAGGGRDVFTTDPRRPGVISVAGESNGRSLGVIELGQGYVYLSATDPAGRMVRYDYDLLPADLPLPVPGGEYEAVAVVSADGVSSTERQTHVFGAEGTLTIGDCTWPLIEVEISWSGGAETRYWFPDPGISVLAGDQVSAITPLALAP